MQSENNSLGALPVGDGLSSLRDEASKLSSPEASIPSAGKSLIERMPADFCIHWQGNLSERMSIRIEATIRTADELHAVVTSLTHLSAHSEPASGMSAGTAETLQGAQGEARQPGPTGDAQGTGQ